MKIGVTEKIILLFVAVIASLSVALGFLFISHEEQHMMGEFDEKADVVVNNYANVSEYPVMIGNIEDLARIGRNAMRQKNVVSCLITDDEENILFSESAEKIFPAKQYSAPIMAGQAHVSDEDVLLLEINDRKTQKIGTIKISFSLADIHSKYSGVKRTVFWVTVICISTAVFLTYLMAFFVIKRPIAKLNRGTTLVSQGNLQHNVSIDSKDEIGMLAASFNRMTQHLKKLMEELEESNRKLEESNSELEDFAYIASHDLREPLRKISGFSDILAVSLEGKLDEDQKENLSFMTDGAQRMQEMIDALLLYSRVTTKGIPMVDTDMNEVVGQILKFELSALIEEKNGTVVIPGHLPTVKADEPQMRQLMQNLIGNGLKYSRGDVDPGVTIRSEDLDNGKLKISVEDNGIGIEEKYHEDVFTMFRRLHARTKYEGSGIGLAVCKKIVKRHGGKIGVESSPGGGSVFWFTLPVERRK